MPPNVVNDERFHHNPITTVLFLIIAGLAYSIFQDLIAIGLFKSPWFYATSFTLIYAYGQLYGREYLINRGVLAPVEALPTADFPDRTPGAATEDVLHTRSENFAIGIWCLLLALSTYLGQRAIVVGMKLWSGDYED